MDVEPVATFVPLDWLVYFDSSRIREDTPIGVVVIFNRSVTLEIFKSRLGRFEPARDEDAVATSELPPGVGSVRYLLLRRSERAM